MRIPALVALLALLGDVDDLASPDPDARARAVAALREEGHASVDRVLDGFAGAPPLARELRARLIRDLADAGDVERVAPLLRDSSGLVRAELAAFLGRPDLGVARASTRASLLLRLLRDSDESIAAAAFQGLTRLADRSIVPDLAAIVRDGGAEQRDAALRVLGATPGSAPALLELADTVARRATAQRTTWLVMLGATGDPSVVPALLRYASHPVDGAAARVGFDLLARILQFRRRDAELVGALRAWREFDPIDASTREARYRLLVEGDTAAARAAAAEIDGLAELESGRRRELRALAKTIDAVANLAEGRGREAEASLADALQWTAAAQSVSNDGDDAEALLIARARLLTLSALNALLNPFDGGPSAAGRVTEAYAAFAERVGLGVIRSVPHILREPESRKWAQRNGRMSLTAPWNFDSAFESDFGPTTLLSLLLPRRGRGAEGLTAGIALLELFAKQNPHEFVSPSRENDFLRRPNPLGRFQFPDVSGPLEILLTMPLSRLPRDLGLIARGVLGDPERAALLLDPVIRRAAFGQQPSDLLTYVDASLERAGVAMDAHDPDLAERTCDNVLAHLDSVRTAHEGEYDPDLVKELGERPEARTAEARRWLELERSARSQTLVSKAVNENVVRGRPKVASGYAKKGVELDPTDFNRVILACYLAREGNAADARAILRDAAEQPSTYYNLACTYALLGEKETALRYLEKDFRDARIDAGGLERQRAWARKDPDLRSLRDDPRFADLVGAAPKAPASPPASAPRR